MTTRPALALCLLVLVTQTIAKKYGGGSPPRTDHSYPHSTGYSGAGGGGHGYPATGGKSGTGTGAGHYPPSSGKSGSGTGHGQTTVHHHYHYSPPQQVRYGSQSHPVYHGQPPNYVYQYRESGSPFGTLLAGLALYNLGRMTAGGSHHRGDYRPNHGEKCMFAVKKDNGDYQETRVDCQLMTSFLFEMDNTAPRPQAPVVADAVPKPVADNSVVSLDAGSAENNTGVIIANKTVDALELKGPEIQVTPSTHCFIIHTTPSSTRRKEVECGLLRTYERSSLRRNSAGRLKPYGEILFPVIVHLFVANFYSTN